MDRRLFMTVVLPVASAVAAVGGFVLYRAGGGSLLAAFSPDLAVAVFVIAALATLPAHRHARRFTRPLDELAAGATRLATGDLGHKIGVGGDRAFADLARTFNAMSDTLAASFAQLERDREQLRTILSGMVEGVVAFDNDHRVLFANETACILLEIAPDAAVGRKLWEVTRQRAIVEIVETAMGDTGPHRAELDWTGPGAKSLAVYVARLPGPDSAGAIMVLHDTSEIRRLERMRQDFVTNVSHELKTPLAVIMSNVEALQDGAADDPAERVEFLGRVSDEADRLELLIQDLLRLARIESGELGLEPTAIPLAAAIAESLDRQATRAEAKTLQMVEVPPPGAPPSLAAWADEEALSTILDNLIDNAIKYTGNGGRITVRWGVTPTMVTVDVQDTGIGISETDQSRVFERFYRADKARSRAAGGTGLGLAIVKHLCVAMKGSVKVASEIGKGSTFSVTLPRG